MKWNRKCYQPKNSQTFRLENINENGAFAKIAEEKGSVMTIMLLIVVQYWAMIRKMGYCCTRQQ